MKYLKMIKKQGGKALEDFQKIMDELNEKESDPKNRD